MPVARMRMGSIPACAGEPGLGVIVGVQAGVYPRLCGGTVVGPPSSWWEWGLSPPVRGNRVGWINCGLTRRSIPACAGEPTTSGWSGGRSWVYPRLCGGTCHISTPNKNGYGLSPPVRGNRRLRNLPYHAVGSIPACAGEPARPRGLPGCSEVYPRLCGGTWPGRQSAQRIRGLSPPVRGNPAGCQGCQDVRRSIPACAGEPVYHGRGAQPEKVYPRLCGGTPCTMYVGVMALGLSPPVRGNLDRPPLGIQRRRSIPACAGEPLLIAAIRPADGVYPRLCGGTAHYGAVLTSHGGLSPPVRGNPRSFWGGIIELRSIPACAGEPRLGSAIACWGRVYPRLCGGTPDESHSNR